MYVSKFGLAHARSDLYQICAVTPKQKRKREPWQMHESEWPCRCVAAQINTLRDVFDSHAWSVQAQLCKDARFVTNFRSFAWFCRRRSPQRTWAGFETSQGILETKNCWTVANLVQYCKVANHLHTGSLSQEKRNATGPQLMINLILSALQLWERGSGWAAGTFYRHTLKAHLGHTSCNRENAGLDWTWRSEKLTATNL